MPLSIGFAPPSDESLAEARRVCAEGRVRAHLSGDIFAYRCPGYELSGGDCPPPQWIQDKVAQEMEGTDP